MSIQYINEKEPYVAFHTMFTSYISLSKLKAYEVPISYITRRFAVGASALWDFAVFSIFT